MASPTFDPKGSMSSSHVVPDVGVALPAEAAAFCRVVSLRAVTKAVGGALGTVVVFGSSLVLGLLAPA